MRAPRFRVTRQIKVHRFGRDYENAACISLALGNNS